MRTPELERIQNHFHALIAERAGELLRDKGVSLPDLSADLSGEASAAWFPVPGMYGGFRYWLEGEAGNLKLVTESWSRVVEGSGQRHVITPAGTRRVAEGFV